VNGSYQCVRAVDRFVIPRNASALYHPVCSGMNIGPEATAPDARLASMRSLAPE